MGYSVVNVNDVEGAGPGGAVRFVRKQLGVEAFGINSMTSLDEVRAHLPEVAEEFEVE